MIYVSPQRQFMPPSDLESEYGGDESDHESNAVSLSKKKSFEKKNVFFIFSRK
jgi:hypothetical protein